MFKRLKAFISDQIGGVKSGVLSGYSDVWMSMIITAVLFVVFPIIMTFTGDIIDWTGGSGGNITQFTGLESITALAPMLLFVAFVFGNVALTAYSAIRRTSDKLSIAIVVSLVMIGVGFVFYLIVLDGADTLLNDANIGDYTGMEAMVGIAPMLILVSYIFGAIATTGMAAYKKLKG